MIWKNQRGTVYAMALSPAVPNGMDGARLILGGYGIEDGAGTLTVFRYPGDPTQPTGELIDHWTGKAPDNRWVGHGGAVYTLTFDPTAQFLASGGQDGTIRIWDVSRGESIRILTDGQDPDQILAGQILPAYRVKALAYTPDGGRLVSGGTDGQVRVWNLNAANDRQPLRVSVGAGPNQPEIRALAVSPDGRWLVAGLMSPVADPENPQEVSGLRLFELPDLKTSRLLPFRKPNDQIPPNVDPFLGEVYDLAFIDSERFAVAVQAERTLDSTRVPRLASWVEIRAAPDGRVLRRVGGRPWEGITDALAVRPDGAQLAFVEGQTRRVLIQDLQAPQAEPIPLARRSGQGVGQSVWDVGFQRQDPTTIAYSTTQAEEGRSYSGFDLVRRLPTDLLPDNVSGAIKTWNNYRVVPVNPFQLDLITPRNQRLPIRLDADLMGRWWNYTFLPPGPDHPNPALAIACSKGIPIYTFENWIECKRLLRGHDSEVYAIAPSPDDQRRWLLTGSADQTIRLWSLAGCDRTAPFGATFRVQGGRWVVSTVANRSPADLQGLKTGDIVVGLSLIANRDPRTSQRPSVATNLRVDANSLMRLDRSEPGLDIRLQYQRPRRGPQFPPELLPRGLATRKFDSPALSFFHDSDADWVIWMPQGYYETSVQGDRLYLGWQVNRGGLFEPRSTAFFPMNEFERQLRRPDIIDTLLSSGSVERALQFAQRQRPDVPPDQPIDTRDLPLLTSIALQPAQIDQIQGVPGSNAVRVRGSELPAVLTIDSIGPGRTVTELIIRDNGMTERVFEFQAQPLPHQLEVTMSVAPGTRQKSVSVRDEKGVEHKITLELVGQTEPPPTPPERKPRLIVLAYGPDFQGLREFELAHAPRDAQEVGERMPSVVVEPRTNSPYEPSQPILVEGGALALGKRLEWLESEVEAGQLGRMGGFDARYVSEGAPVDTIVLFLNTHILARQDSRLLLGPELLDESLTGSEVADQLGRLVERGCRVLVFVDGVHLPPSSNRVFEVDEWVRQLQAKRVGTYVASINGKPSEVRGDFGAFAAGVAQALQGEILAGALPESGTISSEELGDAIFNNVHEETERRQHPKFYPSLTSWDRLPLIRP
jgi:WD40 repeat protein